MEATKLAVAAFNRGDFERLEELYAADAVLQDLQNAPDQPVTVEGGPGDSRHPKSVGRRLRRAAR